MLAVESSHKLSQTAISVCIVISASQCKPKNKNLLFFPLHQVKVWMMSSHLLSTPLLCQAQIQTVTCTIISHFFSIAGEAPAVGKLGFILFIVPIHTRWRDSASISSTLSNFLFKNKKNKLAFSALLDVQMPHPCFAMIDVRKGSFSSIT